MSDEIAFSVSIEDQENWLAVLLSAEENAFGLIIEYETRLENGNYMAAPGISNIDLLDEAEKLHGSLCDMIEVMSRGLSRERLDEITKPFGGCGALLSEEEGGDE